MEQRFKPFVVAWFALVIFSSAMVALAARTQMRTQEALGLREEQGRKLWGGRLSQSPLWVSAPAPMPAATEVGDTKLVITITMDYRLRDDLVDLLHSRLQRRLHTLLPWWPEG